MNALPVHVCLLTHPHDEHDWWYTSYGGGHMLAEFDPTGREPNQKQWHCPGVAEPEPVDEGKEVEVTMKVVLNVHKGEAIEDVLAEYVASTGMPAIVETRRL